MPWSRTLLGLPYAAGIWPSPEADHGATYVSALRTGMGVALKVPATERRHQRLKVKGVEVKHIPISAILFQSSGVKGGGVPQHKGQKCITTLSESLYGTR